MIKTDLKNLNEAWLVVKKYNGKLYFKTDWSYDSKNPKSAEIYWDKNKAQARMEQANLNRKKCKYYLEPAAMHFVNNYEFGVHYWGSEGYIKNIPLALKDLEQGKGTFTKLTKTSFEQKVNSEVDKMIAEKTANFERSAKEHEEQLKHLQNLKTELLSFNIDKITETYGTKAETTAQILYGSK